MMLVGFRYESMLVAVKVIQPNRTSDVSFECKENFQREVTLLSRMKHENIVKVFYFICSYIRTSSFLLIIGRTLKLYKAIAHLERFIICYE
jgi:serine/threonine protein kinase